MMDSGFQSTSAIRTTRAEVTAAAAAVRARRADEHVAGFDPPLRAFIGQGSDPPPPPAQGSPSHRDAG